MSGIVWLASYPKSGNTWVRVLLANYRHNGKEPVDINRLDTTPIASGRELFDELVGLPASDLLPEEIDSLRHEAYARLAETGSGPCFLKIHDAYVSPRGRPLVPRRGTLGALYIIRNPLDVAVSYAHHSSWSLARTVRHMNDDSFAMAAGSNRLPAQLRQRLLSWSGHVRSWVDAAPFPVHVVRFEDLKAHPADTFAKLLDFVSIPVEPERLRRAVAFSDFSLLREMEKERGFKEKAPGAQAFFRSGEVGAWRDGLGLELARRLVERHSQVMERFGYPVAAVGPELQPSQQSLERAS